MNEDLDGKTFFVIPLDPREYKRQKNWLTISRPDEVKNPVHVVWEKHEEQLMAFLKANKYQYGVGLMNVANPVSGPLGALTVDEMHKFRSTEFLLKKSFSRAVFDGRHCRSLIEKLAESGESGTEWTLQSAQMILSKAICFQVLTDYELLRLSWSARVLSGLVLRDTSLISIIKSLVQYSEMFDSGYDVSLYEAWIAAISKDLVSCVRIQGANESSHRLCFRVNKLMRRFPEALKLVKKINEEAAATDSTGKSGLGVAHLDNMMLSSSEEQDLLLLIEAVAAHSALKKQGPTFNCCVFYLYATMLFEELGTVHESAIQGKTSSTEKFF